METRYISLNDAVQCAKDLAEDFAGEGLDSASHGAQAVAEWLKDIPAADVVEKTEWDKLMFLVDAANNVLKSAPKWISVKERLPERECYVLACYKSCFFTEPLLVVTYLHREDEHWFNALGLRILPENVPYWMPLPEPPKEEK